MADNKQQSRIVDVPTVQEVYANQFISAGFDGASITINLGTSRLMPAKMGEGIKDGNEPAVFVTARLAISAPAAIDFITQVSGMLDKIGLTGKGGAAAAPAAKPTVLAGDTWKR
ncbi:MAG: hypothetical protein ACWA6X_06830 [Bauldia sp.]